MIFTKIKELDAVLLNDGREGTVLETYEDGRVFMIEICDEEGLSLIHISTYYKWLDKPEFTQYVDSLISKFTSSELSTVWKALIRRCSIGDVQAIKLYFEMRRELSSKDESGVQIIDDI